MRSLYTTCLYLLLPFAIGWYAWKNRAYLSHLDERFGFGRYSVSRGVWVHAVSVGEVQAAVPLVHALRERYPTLPLTLTTGTPQGRARAIKLFGDEAVVRYLPFDLPATARRFFETLNPLLAIVLETELWPNLFHACDRSGIPLVLASARLSARSVERYRRFARLFADAVSGNVIVGAQSAVDAERFRAIGANPVRISVTGNVKLDFELPPAVAGKGASIRRVLGESRPVWCAGSTHEGEEELLLAAHDGVRESHPDALLLLAPRKPERFSAVDALLRKRNVPFVTRSSQREVGPATEVLLIDTLGELLQFYAASDVAFVGGSLVAVGGHNLLEPAALARPVLTGPHNFNSAEIARLFIGAGGASVVRDERDLAMRVTHYFGLPHLCTQDGQRALQVLTANRGALARLMALVDPLLVAQRELRRAA